MTETSASTSAPRTVIVCDDHPLFREGVVSCLGQAPEVSVVANASDVASAIAQIQIFEPDILVCDLSIPGGSGFDVLRWIAERDLDIQIIVLSMHTELSFVQKARELGASAFLAKEDAETDLLHALRQPKGSFFASNSIGKSTQQTSLDLTRSLGEDLLKSVSPAELRVLALLSESKTSREIAAALKISPKTVDAHRFNLADKLDAKGPNKLLEWAIRNREAICSKHGPRD